MREPIANKTHYPNGSTLLDKEFDVLFHHEKGPGALPSKLDSNESITGVIVPHAPLKLCGPCAAWAYKALAEDPKKPDFYILIGQAQNSSESGATMETHITPYGEVRVDQTFLRELVAKGNIKLNDALHRKESIIEVQLPYLQFVHRQRLETIKIVPLLLGMNDNIDEIAVDIKETLLEQGKTAKFIFITNFTSYGREFRYVPFTEDIPENIAEQDRVLLEAIAEHDKEAFFGAVKEKMIPLSGYMPMQLYFKLFSDRETDLEQYYLSGDINGNYKATVGYGALIIK